MEIVDLEVAVVGNPWKNWVFVILHTDSGLTGLGEATGGLSTRPHEAQLHELRRLVVGGDPLNPRGVSDSLFKALYLARPPAVAGIETACWDILGKHLGTPVWQLLGGRSLPKLRAYANGWYTGGRDPQALADQACEVISRGYSALKFDPFGKAYMTISRTELRESLRLVSAVRAAVGDDVDIMIEAHDRFSVSSAIDVGRALVEFSPFWLEAPVLSTDIDATLRVADAVPIRIAAGERMSSLRNFADLLHPRRIDVLQPELLSCGGVLGLVGAGAVASAYGALLAPHNAQSPYTTVVNTHVGVALGNVVVQECFDDFLEPWSRDLFSGLRPVEGGWLTAGELPGFGVEFDRERAMAHPYSDQNFLRLFADGWERRTGDR